MEKEKYTKYRLFSPALFNEKEIYITGLSDNEDNTCRISNDAFMHSVEDINPIPLDKAFLHRHQGLFKFENGVYECIGNNHTITIDDNLYCSIDGEEYGFVARHELINLLEDICKIHILLPDIPDVVYN